MPKYHKIKWNDADTRELERAVRNFNAKVTRLAKKNPQMKSALPEKVSARQLRELINTRNDLKREINSLKRFSKRGAEQIVDIPNSEYNLKITKWQRTEMNRAVAIINRKRKARLEEVVNLEMTSRGESLGYTKAQIGMGKPELAALRPMNAFYRTMKYSDLKERYKSIQAQRQSDYFTKKDFMLRDNFTRSLYTNYNPNDIQDVVDAIETMDIKEFIEIFQKEGNTFEMNYPTQEEYEYYVTALKRTWIK